MAWELLKATAEDVPTGSETGDRSASRTGLFHGSPYGAKIAGSKGIQVLSAEKLKCDSPGVERLF
jgi:hypothetical protein